MKLLLQSISAVVLSGLLVTSVQAGVRDVGNPGKGVYVGDKLVLLDLYEVGVMHPLIDESVLPEPVYLERAQRLSFLTKREARILASKLTEIRNMSPWLADSLTLALNLYVWRMTDQKLTELKVASPVQLPAKGLQLANRLGGVIRISHDGWTRLDSENRVALVLHEMMMGLFPKKDPLRIRQIVSYLFMPEFYQRGAEGFATFSGIQQVQSKILGENILSVAVDVLSIQIPEAGAFVDLSGFKGKENKDAFCRFVLSISSEKEGPSLTLSYRAKTTAFRFQNHKNKNANLSGLEEIDEDGYNIMYSVPLRKHSFYGESLSHCIALVDQSLAKVYKTFSY